MRARTIPMPQVSVTPAKTKPAPMNAGIPANHPSTVSARTAPTNAMPPAAIRTWRSSDMVLRPRTTGCPACSQASVPPSTFVAAKPAARSFSQAFLAPTTRPANHHERLRLVERGRVELVERQVFCLRDMDFFELGGRPHIDQDRTSGLETLRQLRYGDGRRGVRGVHGVTPGAAFQVLYEPVRFQHLNPCCIRIRQALYER